MCIKNIYFLINFLQEIAEDARIKVEKEQAIAELMAKETSAMAEDAQRDLGKLKI